MGGVNKVVLIGNLGKDPEIRHTQAGKKIVAFNLATSESWRDAKTGDRREETEWHRIVILNDGLANIAEQFLHKGSKIYIEGQLKTRKWQDQQGQDRYTTEIRLQNYASRIELLDAKERTNLLTGGHSPNNAESLNYSSDDDVPF